MRKVGADLSSQERWDEVARAYAEQIDGGYHQHRIEVVRALLPDLNGARVLDFGCGDGLFANLALSLGAVHATGIDQNTLLLDRAKVKVPGADLILGGIEKLAAVPSKSIDCLLAINVLHYVTDEDDATFYRETARILKPGGHLVLNHSNSLFDLFTLNRYTVAFFKDNFATDPTALLREPSKPDRTTFNIRENPLTYAAKLAGYGLTELRQEYMNFHAVPPLLSSDDHDDMARPRPQTLGWPEQDRWRLMFQCSMFGSLSSRRG